MNVRKRIWQPLVNKNNGIKENIDILMKLRFNMDQEDTSGTTSQVA